MYEHAQRHANDHGNDHVHARPNDHSDGERGNRTDEHAGQIISDCENHRRLLISSISDALSCEFLCADGLLRLSLIYDSNDYCTMTLVLRVTHVARRRRTGVDWVARGTALFDMLRISAEPRCREASLFVPVWPERKCDAG